MHFLRMSSSLWQYGPGAALEYFLNELNRIAAFCEQNNHVFLEAFIVFDFQLTFF